MVELRDLDDGSVGASAGVDVTSLFGSGNSLSGEAIDSAQAESGKLLDAAKSGRFRISEQGAKPLIDTLVRMRDRLDGLRRTTRVLAEAPKLGSHEYGRIVAAHDQKGGDGDVRSARAVLVQFDEVLAQSIEALQRASGQYREVEAHAHETFRQPESMT